jgi:hypothetical protein
MIKIRQNRLRRRTKMANLHILLVAVPAGQFGVVAITPVNPTRPTAVFLSRRQTLAAKHALHCDQCPYLGDQFEAAIAKSSGTISIS